LVEHLLSPQYFGGGPPREAVKEMKALRKQTLE